MTVIYKVLRNRALLTERVPMLSVQRLLIFLLACMFILACDKGKRPYQEADRAFTVSDYSTAKNKAAEVIQNAPNSGYLAQAKAIYEKVEKIEALSKAADEAVQTADYKKAIKDYEAILALDGKSPKALESLEKIKGIYKSQLMQEGKGFIESGEYEKGIESYRGILTFTRNDKEAADALKKAETTLADLKQMGDEAMRQFRIYIQARGTRDYQTAEISRVRYLKAAKELCCNISGGRAYLAARLKEYTAEVESALNDFLSKAKAVERSGRYERRVLAADEYNRSLNAFIEKYGRPEAWLEGEGRYLLKKKIVDQWIPTKC